MFGRNVFFLALISMAFAGPVRAYAKLEAGALFPTFSLERVDGKSTLDNMSFKLAKLTVVDFWASWCEPCKAELPFLARMQTKYQNRGLQILGFNVDDTREEASAFIRKNSVQITSVFDKDKKVVEAADISSMPTTVFVDSSGKVLKIHSGFHESEKDAFEKDIIRYLGLKE